MPRPRPLDPPFEPPPLTLLLAALLLALTSVLLTLDALNEAAERPVFALVLLGAAGLAVVAAVRISTRPAPSAFLLALGPAALLLWRGLWLVTQGVRTGLDGSDLVPGLVLLVVPALLLLATLARLAYEARRSA